MLTRTIPISHSVFFPLFLYIVFRVWKCDKSRRQRLKIFSIVPVSSLFRFRWAWFLPGAYIKNIWGMWEVLYCLWSMFTMRKYIVSLGGKRYIALNEIKHVISASSTIAFKVTFMVSTDFFYFIFFIFYWKGSKRLER